MHILLQNTELESVFAEMPREAFEDERYARDSGLPLRTNTNANTQIQLWTLTETMFLESVLMHTKNTN